MEKILIELFTNLNPNPKLACHANASFEDLFSL